MSKETEKLYLPTDDTVDVGKEPLPIESEELKLTMEECKELINSAIK